MFSHLSDERSAEVKRITFKMKFDSAKILHSCDDLSNILCMIDRDFIVLKWKLKVSELRLMRNILEKINHSTDKFILKSYTQNKTLKWFQIFSEACTQSTETFPCYPIPS